MANNNPENRSIEAIANRLLITRESFGSSQSEFAEKAGISPNAYNQYERGKKLPSLKAALALCDTYSLSLDWIYTGDPGGLPHRFAASLLEAK